MAVVAFGCEEASSGGSGGAGADSPQGGSDSGGAGGQGAGPAGSGAGAQNGPSAGPGSGSGGEASSTGPGAGPGSGAGGSGGEGTGGSPPVGLPTLGTLVVLGDSISDGGGQSPFYYNLLRTDLEAHYGAIAYHRKAESGSKTNALMGQLNDLPNTLPGPVAVAITSGGNDMKAALPLIIGGADANARATMQANIDAAVGALTEPDRFGTGVVVHVFHANIYDASDGVGDFGSHGCNFGQGVPTIPTGTFFANWNGAIATAVTGHGQTVADMHGLFSGHGYSGNPNWFASDCTHPNQLGHAALADYFATLITGM